MPFTSLPNSWKGVRATVDVVVGPSISTAAGAAACAWSRAGQAPVVAVAAAAAAVERAAASITNCRADVPTAMLHAELSDAAPRPNIVVVGNRTFMISNLILFD